MVQLSWTKSDDKGVGHSLDTKGVKEPVAALSAAISHVKKSNILTQDLALMVRKLELKSRLHPDRPAAEKLVLDVKWQWGYSCKMIQRYFEVKPACDMLQDSGTWRPDTMSLNRCVKLFWVR